MKLITLSTLIAVLTFAYLPLNAEEGDGFSANLTIASDYSFRGISQTGMLPAIQGGFDYVLDNGFSFGTWASNVNYGDNTSQELDLYFGYSQELNESATLGFTFVQYEYPGEGENYDYQEMQASLDLGSINLGVVYSPNYLGADDVAFTYLSAGFSRTLGEDVSFSASIGLNNADEVIIGEEDSYFDFSVGVSAPFKGIDVGFQVVGTDTEEDAGEARLIFSLGKTF